MIDDTLYDAFGQRQVSTMYTPLNQYHVVMEVDPEYLAESRKRCSISTCGQRTAPGSAQRRSPTTSRRTHRLSVNHQGQFPSVTISFNLPPGMSLGDAVAALSSTPCAGDRRAGPSRQLPGHGAGFQASLASQPMLILAALVTVYIVLGILYESYIHPITILSTLPSAGVGALLALLLSARPN